MRTASGRNVFSLLSLLTPIAGMTICLLLAKFGNLRDEPAFIFIPIMFVSLLLGGCLGILAWTRSERNWGLSLVGFLVVLLVLGTVALAGSH